MKNFYLLLAATFFVLMGVAADARIFDNKAKAVQFCQTGCLEAEQYSHAAAQYLLKDIMAYKEH